MSVADSAGRGRCPTCFLMSVHVSESQENWWIRTCRGEPVYEVIGACHDYRSRPTLVDRDGQVLAVIHERFTGPRDSVEIGRPGGSRVTVRGLHTGTAGLAWVVSAPGLGDLVLLGDLLAHRATLWSTGGALARANNQDAAPNGYQVMIVHGADRVLILAVFVALDRLLH